MHVAMAGQAGGRHGDGELFKDGTDIPYLPITVALPEDVLGQTTPTRSMEISKISARNAPTQTSSTATPLPTQMSSISHHLPLHPFTHVHPSALQTARPTEGARVG